MDRTALSQRAAEIQRRIFASLPWSVRWAVVLGEIARDSGILEAFGRQFGAYMLEAGVEGMPDPGQKWNPKSPNPARTLPRDYCKKLIVDIYDWLTKRWQNPDTVMAAISKYAEDVATGKVKFVRPIPFAPVSMAQAESYIKTGILRAGRDMVREELREQARFETTTDEGEDAKSVTKDIGDPHALKEFEDFENQLPAGLEDELYDFLSQRVHPDIRQYLELRMKGVPKLEILGLPKAGKPSMLPHWHGTPQNWKNYQPKLQRAILEFFRKKDLDLSMRPSDLADLV
jgi:hypothetical protein